MLRVDAQWRMETDHVFVLHKHPYQALFAEVRTDTSRVDGRRDSSVSREALRKFHRFPLFHMLSEN
jgi:hypothetical protein